MKGEKEEEENVHATLAQGEIKQSFCLPYKGKRYG
jgi:hypothetical protein